MNRKLRAVERRQDTHLLRSTPFVCPMVGDGSAARIVTAVLRGGADSHLGRDERGRWRQVLITPKREDLVAARYRDWRRERDQ